MLKNNTVLDESKVRTPSVDKIQNSGNNRRQLFNQNAMNYQRPKLKIWVNGIEFKGLVDKGTDVTIILPKNWLLDWPL